MSWYRWSNVESMNSRRCGAPESRSRRHALRHRPPTRCCKRASPASAGCPLRGRNLGPFQRSSGIRAPEPPPALRVRVLQSGSGTPVVPRRPQSFPASRARPQLMRPAHVAVVTDQSAHPEERPPFQMKFLHCGRSGGSPAPPMRRQNIVRIGAPGRIAAYCRQLRPRIRIGEDGRHSKANCTWFRVLPAKSAQGNAVIALVGDEFGGGRHGFDTALGDLAIMDVSWCQEQDEGPAFRIADSVELGVAAPLGAADAMGQGPPFPPPAQR